MEDDVDFDYISSILDEIALEGLDGITLPSLWKRLEKRPKFPFPMDSDSKVFIWNCIAPDLNLEFYELPQPRVPLVIFNRYQNMDMEFGIVVEHDEEIPDPYPYVPVEDKNVKGSCSNYKTRINVTHQIRDKNTGAVLMTLHDTLSKRHVEQLVVVASQAKRNYALLGSDVSPNTNFGLIQFCLLERIARSRHHGEVTCGKNSLVCLKLPPKTLFYYRKRLLAHKILVKQYHYLKTKEGQLVKGSLLQLARFYVERKSKMEMLIIKMCKALELKPKKEEEYGKLKDELGLKATMFKKMFGKIFQTCVKVKFVPSSELYPDRNKEEHYTQNGKEKLIKVVELVKPYDEHEEDDLDDEDEKAAIADDKQVHFSADKIYADRPLLWQVLKVIDDAGPDGATSVTIGKALGLPKLETRTLLRALDRKGVVITVMQDSGRQRALQYISRRFEDESKAHKQVLEMHQKLMNHTASVPENEELKNMENVDFGNDLNNMSQLDMSVETLPQDEPRKPSKSWSFSLKDINSINNKLNVPTFTYRMLKRANRIIELVKEYKVFDQLHKVQKKIIEEEAEEGVVEKLDRASFCRIIHRLSKDGYIQSIKTILNFGKTTRKLHLICDRSITPDDPLIKRAIDEAKLSYMSSLHNDPKTKVDKTENKENDALRLSKPENEITFEYCPSMGKRYGFQPKCVRMKALHELVSYLVYFYEGASTPIQSDASPPVYVDCQDWRRFLSPVPKRPELKEGFIYFADLLHCLPVCLLVTIVNFNYKINGFEEILNDGEKRNYLIQQNPTDIRNGLLYHRKYVHSIHEVLVKLAFCGLVTFVAQKLKEKEKSLIYVHRKNCLVDTSSSNPGYLFVTEKEYDKLFFEFNSLNDLRNYWMNVERISIHTPLGRYVGNKDETVTIFNIFHKPEMEEASRPKELDEIVDDFKIPGDGLGACGFDSAMYFHLKRNWNWPSISVRTNKPASKKETLPSNIVGSNYISYLTTAEKEAQTVGGKKRLGKFLKKINATKNANLMTETEMEEIQNLPSEAQNLASEVQNLPSGENEASTSGETRGVIKKKPILSDTGTIDFTTKRGRMSRVKPIVRVMKKKFNKVRKPYYDEADKVALKKMTRLRVTWTAQEDSFLLLCKVASCFLDPYYKMVVPYAVVRDMIHEHLPTLSLNKSSRACQRRILYMLKNPVTVTNVSVYLGEANQDVELVKQFQGPKPNKNQEAAWKSMFIEVLKYLLNKFTSKTPELTSQFTLPNTVAELKRKYHVSQSGSLKCKKKIHVVPKNIVDIHCSMVFSAVLQGLHCVGDKTNWAFTLYKIYQCYPDTLLRSVIAKLKHEGIITKRRDFTKREESLTPISSMPHRLSAKFEFILQGKYHESLFHDAYLFLNRLIKASRAAQQLRVTPNIDGYETATLASLLAINNVKIDIEVPEQIIVFDTKVTEEFKQKLLQRAQDPNSREVTLDVPAPSRASRFALYMMRHDLSEPVKGFEVVQHAHDSFLINSCKLKASLEQGETGQTGEDLLDMNLSTIKRIIDSQKQLLPIEPPDAITREDIKKYYRVDGYLPPVDEIGWEIYTAILNRKEIGCAVTDLLPILENSNESEVSLFDHLNVLMNHEAIFRVGVVQRIYVAQIYADPWILNSVKIPKENRSLATEVAMNMKSSSKTPRLDIEIETSEALAALRDGVDHDKTLSQETPPKPARPSKRKVSTESKNSADEVAGKRIRVEEDPNEDPSLISIWLRENVLNKVCQDESVTSDSTLLQQPDEISSPQTMEVVDKTSETTSSARIESEVVKWLEESVLNKVQSVSTEKSTNDPSPEISSAEKASEEVMDTSQIANEDQVQDFGEVKERISLKSWLEAKVTREVEALHQTANKSAGDNSSVAEINRWLQESIVKKLEDKCSVADIKLWFQKCILEKVENQSAINDLQQWFQDSILRTLEDQTFLDDLEIMRQAEEQRIIELVSQQNQQAAAESLELMEVSANESQSHVNIKPSEDVQQWLEDNISKVDEEINRKSPKISEATKSIRIVNPILEQLTLWFEENVLLKIEEQEAREELRSWMNDNVLEKVEDLSLVSEIQEWMQTSLLARIEERIATEDFKRWFEERFDIVGSLQSLQKRIEIVEDKEKSAAQDLKDWFEKTLVEKVVNEVTLREITSWFDSKVLTTIEALNNVMPTTSDSSVQPRETLPLQELKNWLNRKIISRITETDDIKDVLDLVEGTVLPEVVQASNLRKWLEEEVLSVVEEMDHQVLTSDPKVFEISELLQWFDKNLMVKVKDLKDDASVKSWVEENIPKMMEDSLEINNVLSEATISVLSCLKGIVSCVETTEHARNLDFVNVVCCLKDVISKVEDDEIKRVKKEELRKWFEDRIISQLDKVASPQEPVQLEETASSKMTSTLEQGGIDKEVADILETEVLNKIPDEDANRDVDTKMATRKRRRRTFSSTITRAGTERSTPEDFHFEPIKFLSRIWKKPDGSLNRPILRKLLTTVLSHVMSNPGISEKLIFDKFEMCMPPVQILDILEMLKDIGCIETRYLKKSCKSGVFSGKINYTLSETFNLKDYYRTNIYYEATVCSILKLGKFIDELIISH